MLTANKVLAHDFLSRCKLSILSHRQPKAKFYTHSHYLSFRYGNHNKTIRSTIELTNPHLKQKRNCEITHYYANRATRTCTTRTVTDYIQQQIVRYPCMVINPSARGQLKTENVLVCLFFPSPFGPEMFASKDRVGRLFSRQPAHSTHPLLSQSQS